MCKVVVFIVNREGSALEGEYMGVGVHGSGGWGTIFADSAGAGGTIQMNLLVFFSSMWCTT